MVKRGKNQLELIFLIFILEIIESSDLNILTRRQLRERLQEYFPDTNMLQYKQKIDEWIDEALLFHSLKERKETEREETESEMKSLKIKKDLKGEENVAIHSSQPLASKIISSKSSSSSSLLNKQDFLSDKQDFLSDKDDEEDGNDSTSPSFSPSSKMEKNDSFSQKRKRKEKNKKNSIKKVKVRNGKNNQSSQDTKTKENPFNRPLCLSDPLASLLNCQELSRPKVVKELWSYIKSHNLHDKAFINCDEKLKAIFKKDRIHCFTMNKILSEHLMKPEEIIKK